MKKIHFLFISLLYISYSNAQSWVNVGAGTDNAVAGFTEFKGLLYVGGIFHNAGGESSNCIATWNAVKWDSVANGISATTSNGVGALAAYDSMLYAGGQFYLAGNDSAKSIAQWNNTAWDSVGVGITEVAGQNVNSLAVYKGELYAGGNFSGYKSGVSAIMRWNGTTWDSVTSGVNGAINALCVYNGELYVAGAFYLAGGIPANNIAKWDGTKWDSVGNGIKGGGEVNALGVSNGMLFVGGDFTTAGGIPVNDIAVWDGTKWDSLGSGTNNQVVTFATFNNKLYVGGAFSLAGNKPINQVAEWDGNNWYPVGTGLSGGSEGVWALYVYDSILYAGGDFTAPVKNIAMWNGPLGVDEILYNKGDIKVFPNPSSGKFTIQSSVISGQLLVEIYNEMGQKVASSNSSEGGALKSLPSGGQGWALDLSNQPAGIYLYRVITHEGELVGTGKLIIE